MLTSRFCFFYLTSTSFFLSSKASEQQYRLHEIKACLELSPSLFDEKCTKTCNRGTGIVTLRAALRLRVDGTTDILLHLDRFFGAIKDLLY